MDGASTAFDQRAFRAGTIAGGLALLAALGAFKNFMAMFSGERDGYVLFGFLALQYSASQVWFGYAFSGLTGQLLRIPHILSVQRRNLRIVDPSEMGMVSDCRLSHLYHNLTWCIYVTLPVGPPDWRALS